MFLQILSGSLLTIYYLASLHSPMHPPTGFSPEGGDWRARLGKHLSLSGTDFDPWSTLEGGAGGVVAVMAALEVVVCSDAIVCAAACALKVTLAPETMFSLFFITLKPRVE